MARKPLPKSVPLSRSLPKWLQVVSAVESDIKTQARDADLRLPTESELSKRYGVSLVTVRQALAALERRGLIVRKRKLGTLIRVEGLRKRIQYNLDVISDVFNQQRSDRAEVLSREVVAVPGRFKESFEGQRNVMRFVRKRFTNDLLGSYATNFIRLDVSSEIDLSLLETLPITQIIHERTSFRIGHMEQELIAEIADPTTAKNLNVEPLSAVVRIVGRTFGRDGRLLDLADIVYRADAFVFLQRVNFE